jgi:hypothetical protein
MTPPQGFGNRLCEGRIQTFGETPWFACQNLLMCKQRFFIQKHSEEQLINRDDGEINDAGDNVDWRVYVDTGAFQLIGSRGRVLIHEPGIEIPSLPDVFDPLLLGAAFVGDMAQRASAEKVLPIHVESLSGDREVESATRLELEKIGDHWLPVKAVIRCPSEETTVKLNWKSVNEPLDEGLFGINRVAKQYGLSVSDQRGFKRAD